MTVTPEPDAEQVTETTDEDRDARLLLEAARLAAVAARESESEDDGAQVRAVLDQVKERGFITTGEIFAAFPDLEPDTDELRDLWNMFESRGIKVLDEIAEELQLEDQRRAGSQSTDAPAAAPAPRRRA